MSLGRNKSSEKGLPQGCIAGREQKWYPSLQDAWRHQYASHTIWIGRADGARRQTRNLPLALSVSAIKGQQKPRSVSPTFQTFPEQLQNFIRSVSFPCYRWLNIFNWVTFPFIYCTRKLVSLPDHTITINRKSVFITLHRKYYINIIIILNSR